MKKKYQLAVLLEDYIDVRVLMIYLSLFIDTLYVLVRSSPANTFTNSRQTTYAFFGQKLPDLGESVYGV